MEQINVFTAGLNRDINPHLQQEGTYYYMENGDIANKDELKKAVAVNILGNAELTIQWPADVLSADDPMDPYHPSWLIRGSIPVRDDLVLFYLNDVDGLCKIDLLKYVGSDVYTRIKLIDAIDLSMTSTSRLHGVARYDNPAIIQIYFADKNVDDSAINELMAFNAAPDSINGTISNPLLQASYSRVNGYDIDDLRLQGKIGLGAIFVNSEVSGDLRLGTVMYACRYFNKYGNKTRWSQLSAPYPLVRRPFVGNTQKLEGDQTTGVGDDLNSFKGLELLLYYDYPIGTHEYIEVARMYYSGINNVPNAQIIARQPISSTFFTIIDSTFNSNYGTIDTAEFIEQQPDFTVKTMTVRDNRLYCANVIETDFEVEYDARVFRFDNSGNGLALVQGGTGDTYVQESGSILLSIPPATHDCICPYNSIIDPYTFPSASGIQYTNNAPSKGNTLGATGVNINMTFVTTDIPIGNLSDINYVNITAANSEYIKGIKRIFEREEIYRFGVRFFDSFGRQSTVKWIGDIRMPSRHELGGDFILAGGIWYYRNAVPTFTVAETPEVAGYTAQIVYVKRESNDRTIVTKGVISPVHDDMDGNVIAASFCTPMGGNFNTTNASIKSVSIPTGDTHTDMLDLISPEVCFNKNIDVSGATFVATGYIDILGSSTFSTSHAYSRKFYVGNYVNGRVSSYSISYPIVDANAILTQGGSANLTGISVVSRSRNQYPPFVYLHGERTTCLIVDFDTPLFLDIYSSFAAGSVADFDRLAIGKFVRLGGQYGGSTYEARKSNVYIPASSRTGFAAGTLTVGCYYGDMFAGIFESTRGGWIYDDVVGEKYGEVLSYPTTSSINLYLRHDDTYSKLIGTSNPGAFELNETGTPMLESGLVVNYSPINLYNSVYSVKNELELGAAEDADILKINKFDCTVKYSDVTTEGDFYDSWRIFRTNNKGKAETAYGSINYILTKNNNTYVFQDSGISVALINPLVQAPPVSGEVVVLGTGSALERFSYISTQIGIQKINEAVESVSFIYFLDINKKKIYVLADGLQALSDMKNMASWFYNTIDENSEFIGVYDNSRNSVLMTIKNIKYNTVFDDRWFSVMFEDLDRILVIGEVHKLNMMEGNTYELSTANGKTGEYKVYSLPDEDYITFERVSGDLFVIGDSIDCTKYIKNNDSYSLCFNEELSTFVSFESHLPTLYVKGIREPYSTNDDRKLYIHNIGKPGEFYGTRYPFIVDFIVNGNMPLDKIMTAFELNARVLDYTLAVQGPMNYVGVENETINEVSIVANNRTTEFIPLVMKNKKTSVDTDDNIDATVYGGAYRQLRDTNGMRIVPYPSHLYNADTNHNKVRFIAPRIKVINNGNTVRWDSAEQGSRPVTEHIRGTYFIVRLIFNNVGDKRINIHDVISYFDTSINF